MQNKKSFAKKGTNEWKLFNYLKDHKSISSRDSKYPPLEIMDLPKLISDLIRAGYDFKKVNRTKVNADGITKRYVEYFLNDNVELI